jgi:hypothetical protein
LASLPIAQPAAKAENGLPVASTASNFSRRCSLRALVTDERAQETYCSGNCLASRHSKNFLDTVGIVPRNQLMFCSSCSHRKVSSSGRSTVIRGSTVSSSFSSVEPITSYRNPSGAAKTVTSQPARAKWFAVARAR